MSEIRYITVPPPVTVELQHPVELTVAYVDHIVEKAGLPGPIAALLKKHIDEEKKTVVERTLYQLVKERSGDTAHFCKDADSLFAAAEVRSAFLGSKPGDVIGLSLESWKILCESLRKPSGAYNADVMIPTLSHVRAILDAPSTRPAPPIELPVAAE